MHKNINSPTKLTEFAPLSQQDNQPGVVSLFSKFFSFTKNISTGEGTEISPNNDEQSCSSGDSESWKGDGLDREKSPVDDDSSTSMSTYPVDTSEGRSLPNVLKRISNIVALKSNNLQSYKDSHLRSYWMPDKKAKQCYECGERFTTFRRRHHCRVCGQIFCSKCCSDEIPGKIMGCTGDLRVCTYCCKVVLSYLQSSDMKSVLSADLKALQEDLQLKYGNDSIPVMENMSSSVIQDDTRISRKPSVGYMEEKYAIGTSGDYLSSQERANVLKNSTSLRIICEELFRSNQAINLQTHRIRLKNHYNCFTGSELVNWMIAQNKAATRIQGEAIGQALLEANFIESVQSEVEFSDSTAIFRPTSNNLLGNYLSSSNQSSCDGQEPAWVKNIPQNDSTTDSESETKPSYASPPSVSHFPTSGSSFYLDLNLEDSTVTLKRPKTSQDINKEFTDSSDSATESKQYRNSISKHDFAGSSTASVGSDELLNDDALQTVQQVKEINCWYKVNNLRNSFGEMSAYNNLSLAYKQHEDYLIKQLLNSQGLSQNWSEMILSLAHQIIDQVRPDENHNADDMDIRQYVQIKKLPGGNRSDCEIVSGVVCSKNIAHRAMHSTILNPKILLLQCGLMYQRVEGKLLSLEPVMLQEKEYLGYTVARIMALRPNIVMVHRSVSRLAQDKFKECGVTLVLNVKLPVLERVARCTGATIVNTIDAQLTTRFKLGTCQKFYLRSFSINDGSTKTLMCFEGCADANLGSTILLRGGSLVELKKVKNVMSMMLFAVYSWRLEMSFLMDEFAEPPSQKDDCFLHENSNKDSVNNLSESYNDKLKLTASKSSTNDNYGNNIFNDLENKNTDINSYDTLKLFKSNKKSSHNNKDDKQDVFHKTTQDNEESLLNNDSNINDCENDILIGEISLDQNVISETSEMTFRLKEKVLSEEKRVHGESVSDQSDPLHQYLNEEEDIFSQTINSSSTSQNLSVADLPLLNKFKKALDDTVLSFSPYLKFTIPYLETEPGRNCVLRKFFPKEIFYSAQFSNKIEGIKANNINNITQPLKENSLQHKLKPRHPFTLMKFTSGVDSKEVQTLLADFRARGSRLPFSNNVILEKNTKVVETESTIINDSTGLRWPDCLDPASHQRLPVLFCSFSHNANNVPAFCLNPWIVNMDLYGRNDIALGRFLERYCLTSEYKCPATACRAQIDQHGRRFAHDGSCVHISLKKISSDVFRQENQHILMWSKCIKCKNVSPVVPMSSDTWSLSFAKYLELRFHGNVYTNRSSDTCNHSLHHDHYQYFSKNNMLAVFKFTKILLWEISLPPPLIHITYDAKQHANIIEEVKNIALKGDEVFCGIKEKLMTLQIDQDGLNPIKQQLNKEQQYFKNKIEEIQLKLTSPTLENKKLEGKTAQRHVQAFMFRIEDGIVILKRLISEAVSNWNARILDLATKKKDERFRRFTERSQVTGSSGIIDTDGYITEDTASESLVEDLSPMSADYNAIDIISKVQSDFQLGETLESSDNEVQETGNQTDVVILQDSPKSHHRSHSDVLPITLDDIPDKKKKKKTILSQLLPSAPIITPISNPLGALEHHLLPLGSVVPVVVYESEPSSIIAYALDSHDYKHALQEIIRTTKAADQNSSPLNKRKLDNKDNSVDSNQSENNLQTTSSTNTTDAEEDKKIIKQQNYIEVQFADDTTNFYCRIYFAAQFAALRENVLPCGEDGFTRSLCRSVQWAARGGKSGSAFCKSRDDRFILKELSRVEMQIFLDFAPNYFAYMEKCLRNKQPTLLGKIIGVYRVSFKNNTTNASLKTSVLVMENLFYSRTITDKYDLKGSVRNRLVNLDEADHEGELVLLDENLLNMSCDSPLYIRPHSKDVLNKAIEQDTKFLAENSVMDYSLLVGIEPDSNELVLGIIDYIRTFTWDKKLETMVKKSGILGGQGKLPTIVSPEEYRARFIVAMHRYFLPVPDRWTGLGRGVESS
ncbi:1-phosphatidylinositol 3-phosphate 5-kinase [Chelonus insularis]|uniref:1-phosphatidylinositol 3-phosphate 5-kinase n=1 Tax=Chelonus insularis TaxID=460826 RepID=UPI0015883408|nr:1-phosphatidylinositol 3-phosphate 5-kinase [Chelonus insularis]